MEETGRALFTGPVLATVVAATHALTVSGDADACARYLPPIADGTLLATVAVSESSAAWSESDIQVSGRLRGDQWILNGTKQYVLSGAQAGLIIVAARTDRGVSLFAVETTDPGVTVQPLPVMDLTRRVASV
ncbi:acyl-CoA dehydrogenase family protein, partial [Mycobacterium avium]